MQISTSYLFNQASQQMGKLQSDLAKSHAQISAQKQILNPSDAPDQSAAILRLNSVMARQDSFSNSLDTIKTRLSTEDSTLSGASELIIRVKEISLQAANAGINNADRQALGIELKSLRNQLLSFANTQDSNGNYLFAGSRVTQPAFSVDEASGNTVYQGDQTQMKVMIGEQHSIAINRSGSEAFVRVVRLGSDGENFGVGFFQSLDDLTTAVNNSDLVGIQRGIGEVDSLHQGMTLAQANVGTDMNVVDLQTTVIQDTTLNLKTTLSNLEDLDYATAFTLMNKQLLALEAAQSSFAKISQLSLFNYIK
jgi:flagellar hook-associated protein 3 FlgL